MPDTDKIVQNYLVTVSRMCTSDDADVVATMSYVVEEKNLINPESKLLPLSVEALALTYAGLTGTPNLRPMTEDEIKAYRDAD